MKVILLADVPKLGRKSEIKNVSEGFAKNYLFPRGLARILTPETALELERQTAQQKLAAEQELIEAEKLAKSLDGLEIELALKISPAGQGYTSVSAQRIAQTLQKLSFPIKKNQIEIKEAIKKVGEYPVTVLLNHGLEAEIKIVVVAEPKKKQTAAAD